MEQKFLTYGLLDGNLVHISEVVNGLKCNCICANCRQPLIAKNNQANIKLPHFAHHSTQECAGAYETALHLLAKAVLIKYKKLKLPDFKKGGFLKRGPLIEFDNVGEDGHKICVGEEIIIPDAICTKDGRHVFIEFANTHFIEEQKRTIIKKAGTACIEIDLAEQALDENALLLFFLSSSESIYWICNPEREKQYEKYLDRERQKKVQREHDAAEHQRQEELRLQQFRNDKTVKVLKRKYNTVPKCPRKRDALNRLRERGFGDHPVLKRIIDGEYWNEKIYEHDPVGRSVFLSGEQFWVYPTEQHTPEESELIYRRANFFYRGLQEIIEAMSGPEIGDCENCEFSLESLCAKGEYYEICRHP